MIGNDAPGVVLAKRGRLATIPLPAGDAGVFVTIEAMKEMAIDGAKHPLIRQRARGYKAAAGSMGAYAALDRLWSFLRAHVVFRRDPPGVELLRHPSQLDEEIRRENVAYGDCDELSTYAASIVLAMGLRAGFAVISGPDGGRFRHVFAIALVPGRGEVPLDSQDAPGFGVELPSPRRRSFYIDAG